MPFDTNGVTDMCWPAKHNWTAVAIGCQEDWKVNLTRPLSEVCFGSSRETVNHSRLRQICIRDLTNIQYLISAGIINKISNRGYGCAREAGELGAEEERPDEQYENRNRN
jgi:hypothetical protein